MQQYSFSLFPSLQHDINTELAAAMLQAAPVNIVDDPATMQQARAALADALFVFADQLQACNLVLVYLYSNQGSGGSWGRAAGVTTYEGNYTAIGLSVNALQRGAEHFVAIFAHEMAHVLQAQKTNAPVGQAMPHDDIFMLYDEALQAAYYQATGAWIDDGYIGISM